VGDNLARAAEALGTALHRAQVVITTGGLGPTADDLTREAAAQATGRDLVFVPELMAEIEAFFRARGFPLSPSTGERCRTPNQAALFGYFAPQAREILSDLRYSTDGEQLAA
jgi:nicotinamide-nucleotide amidase